MKQLPTTQHEAMEWFASHGAGDGWIDMFKVRKHYRDEPHYGAKQKIVEKGFLEKSEGDKALFGLYRLTPLGLEYCREHNITALSAKQIALNKIAEIEAKIAELNQQLEDLRKSTD